MNFFRLEANTSRIFGLDLLRFFAIMFVAVGHSKILLPDEYKGWIDKFIVDGVSIFFVLSGFLIGGILVRQVEKRLSGGKELLTFWSRRWLRTLPAYFVVLTLVVVYTATVKPTRLPDDWFRYFLFIQNLGQVHPPFFAEAWSLSIEEWFYLLTPVLLFSGLALFRTSPRRTILWVIGLIISGAILYRWYIFHAEAITTEGQVEDLVMKQVLTRLDSIMFGVLGAFLAFYFPKTWKKLDSLMLLILCVISLYFVKYSLDVFSIGFFTVWVPVLKSLTVLGMLPFLSQWKTLKFSMISTFITFISLISYSMYLTNRTIVIDMCVKFGLHDNLYHPHHVPEVWIWEYLLFWFLTIGFSFLLYKLVEVPFMKLRKKESQEAEARKS